MQTASVYGSDIRGERAGNTKVKRVSNWLMALSDFMIACPDASAKQAAQFFGKSEAWISQVKNSDAFRSLHSARREEHFDRISGSMREKLTTLAEVSIDELVDRIDTNRDKVTFGQLHDAGKLALNALGFGGSGTRNGGVNVNVDSRTVVVHDAEALERSRETLRQLRERNDAQFATVVRPQEIADRASEQIGEAADAITEKEPPTAA
ncbi:MAG: hypothetical protein OXL41_03950 [Nitrospinae bacterium]|nr:hypothetical protein [Nitrospinota bacterium]